MRASLDPAAVVERRARVASMTAQGVSARDIAVALRISERTVVRTRRDMGISLAGAPVSLTDLERQRASELLADGCSYSEVARTLGRCPETYRKNFPGRGWSRQACGQFAAAVRLANQRMKSVSA